MADTSMHTGGGVPDKGGPGRVRRFYTPPTDIRAMPGVVKKRGDDATDAYTGTKADLVAAGLLAPELFPGEPGMGQVSVTLWPNGAPKGAKWRTPGRMHVNRLASGGFTITLVVDEAEQKRRAEFAEAEQVRQNAAYEAAEAQRKAERRAGMALEDIIEVLGIEHVSRQVHRLHRRKNPLRGRARLELVWSAPRG